MASRSSQRPSSEETPNPSLEPTRYGTCLRARLSSNVNAIELRATLRRGDLDLERPLLAVLGLSTPDLK